MLTNRCKAAAIRPHRIRSIKPQAPELRRVTLGFDVLISGFTRQHLKLICLNPPKKATIRFFFDVKSNVNAGGLTNCVTTCSLTLNSERDVGIIFVTPASFARLQVKVTSGDVAQPSASSRTLPRLTEATTREYGNVKRQHFAFHRLCSCVSSPS